MEFFGSVCVWLAEDSSMIAEGYVEFTKPKVWKLIIYSRIEQKFLPALSEQHQNLKIFLLF